MAAEQEMRLVENTEANVKTFGRPNKPNGKGFELKPGINEISEKLIAWIEAEKNSSWTWYTGKKIIVVRKAEVEKADGGTETTEGLSLADLHKIRPAEAAIDLVQRTFDKAVLLGWQTSVESRVTVQRAIAEQLEKLSFGDRPPGDDDASDGAGDDSDQG